MITNCYYSTYNRTVVKWYISFQGYIDFRLGLIITDKDTL